MAGMKLLIIDDEKDFVEAIAARLAAKGLEILKAFDGREGLEKARSEKPDLVILDVIMPEMNGYDVCRKLKVDEDKDVRSIPVIMLTAKFEPNDIKFGREMGADAYMTKPLELEPLLREIDRLLSAKKKAAGRGSRPRTDP